MKRLMMITLALSFAARPLFAEEESEKVRKARYETELEKEADRVNESCGTKLEVSIDWASFDADARWQDKSVSGYCEAPMNALRHYCEGKNGKAYIQKTVKKLVCRSAKDKAGWKATLKAGSLEWAIPPDASNADEYARTQLLRGL